MGFFPIKKNILVVFFQVFFKASRMYWEEPPQRYLFLVTEALPTKNPGH